MLWPDILFLEKRRWKQPLSSSVIDENKTSHTYDEVTAEEVYEAAKVFFLEFERFIAALESKL